MNFKVKDVMTAPAVTVKPETDTATAVKAMQRGDFGTLPVVDRHGKLVGMLTDRDVAVAAASCRRNPAYIGAHEAMSSHPITCRADSDIAVALDAMASACVRRLPVVDDSGQLVGLLSIDDIVQRALDVDDPTASSHFLQALKSICVTGPLPAAFDPSETMVSG